MTVQPDANTWPLPPGTTKEVWERAAALTQSTIDELLAEKVTVRAASYEEAERQLRAEAVKTADTQPHSPELLPPPPHVLLLGAERILTTSLCNLQDGKPLVAFHLLVTAMQQISLAIQANPITPIERP